MSGLVHPNLVVLRGVCLEPTCIVMEYMNAGTLYALVHAKTIPGDLPLDLIVQIGESSMFSSGERTNQIGRALFLPFEIQLSVRKPAEEKIVRPFIISPSRPFDFKC